MPAVTQAEFARLEGKARSYITALKNAGRLVMTADDLVDIEASRALIAATADPGRDDVAAKYAARARELDDSPKMAAALAEQSLSIGQARADQIEWLAAAAKKDPSLEGLRARVEAAVKNPGGK